MLGNLISFGRSVVVVDNLSKIFANSIANNLQFITTHQIAAKNVLRRQVSVHKIVDYFSFTTH